MRFVRIGLLTLLATACTSIERMVLPNPVLLDERWARAAPPPGATVDHRPWDELLGRYLAMDATGANRFNYGAVTSQDRATLQEYLRRLQKVNVEALTRTQQLAYWINLYNAQTVALILANYPVRSIREINGGLLSFGPWEREVVTVVGENLSLNDIEHRIIRPVFGEPRIHYALNCAAVGCPNMAPQAWRADGIKSALVAAEHAYVNDPRGVNIDEQGRLTLSKIYAWFREDFGDSEADVIARLARVAEPALRAQLQGRTSVDHYQYNWALNDRPLGPE